MSTNSIGVTTNDLRNLACAATGASINRANDSEELKQMLLFGGGLMALPTGVKAGKAIVWDLPKWCINNYGNYQNAFGTAWNNSIGQTNLYSANRAALKGNFWSTVQNTSLHNQVKTFNVPTFDTATLNAEKNSLARLNKVLQPKADDNLLKAASRGTKRTLNNYKITKNANELIKADIYKDVNRLIEESKGLSGKRLQVKLRQIEKAKAEAEIAIQNAKAAGTIKSATKIGRAASYVKTKTGIRAAETALTKATLSSNAVVKTLAKGAKAGGGMVVISAAMEAPTIYKTYKELGAAKGTKQLGKSIAVVGAETAGYVVGAKVGGIAGAKIGATIGTCIGGPIGTAIGGVIGGAIGIAGGLLCSWLCGKAARKIVGKDELEIAKEKQAKKLANEAKNDQNLQIELANIAREKLENGEIVSEKDANDIIRSYNNVAENIKANETIQDSNSTQTVSTTTSRRTANSSTKQYDAGFQSLVSLAGKSSQSNFGASNSFGFQSANPLGYSNPFMFGGYNLNMNNQFNPFMMNFNSYAA